MNHGKDPMIDTRDLRVNLPLQVSFYAETCQRVEKSMKNEIETALRRSVVQKPSELDHIARQR